MKQQRVLYSLALLAALALAGCGKKTSSLQPGTDTTAPAGSDQAQVATVLQNNPDYVNEDVWQTSTAQSLETTGSFAAIRPLRFWREITRETRTTDTEFGAPDSTGRPTLALVTVHRHFLGTFDIAAGAPDPADTSRSLIKKPLDDNWTRKLVLMRLPELRDATRSRWHLVGTSAIDVHTRGGSTHINSVRIQAGTIDTTITDPLELHRLRRIVLLQAGEPVTLTATTGNAGDVVLFYGFDMRRKFTNNGDGTFTFTFPAGRFPGLRHFGVDALSHGTLFDDTAAYESHAWVVPIAVDPQRAPVDAQ
jgi:predicted small lipoprotein YifL